GSCQLAMPSTAGVYELRLYRGGGTWRLATSPKVGVGVTLSPGGALSFTASPSTVSSGGTATAAWSNVSEPSGTDWIALYPLGALDQSWIDWKYVSCSRTAGGASNSGSCG